MMAGRFRWFAMAAVAILLSCGASAQAAGPEKEIFPFEGSFEPFVECPEQGFNIRIDFFGIDVVKTWRDSAGNVTRIKIHSYGTGTLVNTSDPTKTETGSSPTNITVDFLAETFTVSGMPLHNNIPGEGRVAHETGTITFPIEVIDRTTGEFEVDFDVVLRSGGKHPEFVDWCSMVD
jgi:hypothetical protein